MSFLTGLRVQADELQNLQQMFLKIDTSQDGFLSQEELKRGMCDVLGVFKATSTSWSELVEQLDLNHDGRIDYGEFMTAAVNRVQILSQ